MSKPYVYQLSNPVTGEFYIGYRSNNTLPANEDLGKVYFTSSKVVKPRFSDFNYTILNEFDSKEDAFDYEQEVIGSNWGNPLLLNKSCHHGKARFINTSPLSEEARNKISAAHKGKPRNDITKKKIGDYHRGKTVSEETKQKIRASQLGKILSDDHKRKISESGKGKTKPKGFGEKVAENNKNRTISPETRLKMSLAKKCAHKIMVCRISDKKEMLVRHFLRWSHK